MARIPKINGRRSSRGEWNVRFAAMNLQPVDEAKCVVRQDGVRFYVEEQYAAYAAEQLKLHDAEGKRRSRRHEQIAASTKTEAERVKRTLVLQEAIAAATREHAAEVERVLRPHVRRGRFETTRYYLTTAALVFGDVAGVGGAAITLGEEPLLAMFQALASGTAAVTAGLVGREVKDIRLARRRARDTNDLPKELRTYQHLFRGSDEGEPIVKLLVYGSLTVAAVIATSIMALRWSTEGMTAGIVFGGLAAAISLASFINVFTHTDDVADLVDTAKHASSKEEKKHSKLARNRHLRRHGRAVAAIASIEAEHGLSGEAASLDVTARMFEELSKHPGVAGHGYKVDPSAPHNGTGDEADGGSRNGSDPS